VRLTIMKIVHYPHPALRHPAKPLANVDKALRLSIGEMKDLMYEAKGLGLAAPQVALPYQLLVMNVTGDPNQPEQEEVFINPVIVERKGVAEEEEGCLSFPGLYQNIRRARTVRVQAYDLKGRLIDRVVHDLEARAWQHEIDHLNGVLFIDMMGPLARLSARFGQVVRAPVPPSSGEGPNPARPEDRRVPKRAGGQSIARTLAANATPVGHAVCVPIPLEGSSDASAHDGNRLIRRTHVLCPFGMPA